MGKMKKRPKRQPARELGDQQQPALKLNEQNLKVAAARQLAAIAVSRNEIAHLKKQQRDLYVSYAMILFIPLASQLFRRMGVDLFDRIYQYFYEIFHSLNAAIYYSHLESRNFTKHTQHDIDLATEEFRKISVSVLDSLLKSEKFVIEFYKEFQHEIKDLMAGGPENLIKVIAKMDEIDSRYDCRLPDIQNAKMDLANFYYRLVNDIDIPGLVKKEDGAELKCFKELYDLARNHLKVYAALPHLKKSDLASISGVGIVSDFVTQLFLLVPKVIAKLGTQYLFINPLLNKLLPLGISPSGLINQQKDNFLSADAARRLLTEFAKEKDELSRRILIQSLALLALILFSVTYLIYIRPSATFSYSLYYADLVALAFSTMIIGSSELVRRGYRQFNYYRWHHQLNYKEKLWNQLNINKTSLSLVRSDLLQASYFVIDFSAHQEQGKQMARFFKTACYFHGIACLSQRANIVCIDTEQPIDSQKLENIKNLFCQLISRQESVEQFTEQLEQLASVLKLTEDDFLIVPTFDKDHLPTIDACFYLSPTAKAEVGAIKALFLNYDMTEEPIDESHIVLRILGSEPVKEDEFRQGIRLIYRKSYKSDYATTNMTLFGTGTTYQHAKASGKKSRSKTKHETSEINEKEAPGNKFPRQEKLQAEVDFDYTQHPEADLYPLYLNNMRPNNLPKGGLFMTPYGLTLDKVNNNERLLKTIKQRMEVGHRCDRYGQGIKFWPWVEKNFDGKDFEALLKIKLGGEFGNVRPMLGIEEIKNGNTLLTVKGICFKAH